MKLLRIISILGIIALVFIICANTVLIFIRKDYPWYLGMGMNLMVLIPVYMFLKLYNVSTEGEDNQYKEENEELFRKMEEYRQNQYKTKD